MKVSHRGIFVELSARIVVVWVLMCYQMKQEVKLFGHHVVNCLRIREIGLYECNFVVSPLSIAAGKPFTITTLAAR